MPEEMREIALEIEDFLSSGYWEISAEREPTRKACREVLRRLPSEIRERIMVKQSVILIAPGGADLGLARPMTVNAVKHETTPAFNMTVIGGDTISPSLQISTFQFGLVYLSPELDEHDCKAIVAVVAHEIAHTESRNIVGENGERQADALIRTWGFGKELDYLRAVNLRHRW